MNLLGIAVQLLVASHLPARGMPVCEIPQHWGDDGFKGIDCDNYKGCRGWTAGTRGLICNCKTHGSTHILKIAKPGEWCALGDEWNTMHRLINASCVVKPFEVDATIDLGVILARRIIRITKVKGPKLLIAEQEDPLLKRSLPCQGVRRTFKKLARLRLHAHDSYHGNFIVTDTPECPITVIDMPQYIWPKVNSSMSHAHAKHPFPPWIANQTRLVNGRHNHHLNANCIGLQAIFPCLSELCSISSYNDWRRERASFRASHARASPVPA